jgi:hypothetical protein
MSLPVAIPAAMVIVAAITAGCSSSSEQAPICSSLDQLRTSVSKITQLQPGEISVDQLKSDLGAVQADLQQVLADAKDEFSAQVAPINKDLTALKSAVRTAADTRSATDIKLAADAAKSLGTDVKKLADDAKSKC